MRKEKVGLAVLQVYPDGSAVFKDDRSTIHRAEVSFDAVADTFNSSLAKHSTHFYALQETGHALDELLAGMGRHVRCTSTSGRPETTASSLCRVRVVSNQTSYT